MPYLYTTAEETSRTGIPIIRPLFLEYPHATADNHPLDDDAPGEFFFGPSILVAESPLPDDIAPYQVHLPPGVWYDYWTGAKLDRRETLTARDLEIRNPTANGKPHAPAPHGPPRPRRPPHLRPRRRHHPHAAAGAIHRGKAQRPPNPPRLRPSRQFHAPCAGDLYTDDGLTFDFRHGAYLRLHLTCSLAPDGALTVTIPAREGTFHPWWTQYRIEAIGFTPHHLQSASSHRARATPSPSTTPPSATPSPSPTPASPRQSSCNRKGTPPENPQNSYS